MISGLGRSPGEGNGKPLQYSCLENPRDGGAWCAAVHGVAKSQTRLKRLSRSSLSDSLRSGAVAHQARLSTRFLRQEYWSGLPFPYPGDLPDPGIKPTSPVSPALKVDFLLLSHQKCVEMLVAQSCPTLCHPMVYTAQGILQARILEWVVFPFTRGSSQPRNQTQVSHITDDFFTS